MKNLLKIDKAIMTHINNNFTIKSNKDKSECDVAALKKEGIHLSLKSKSCQRGKMRFYQNGIRSYNGSAA